MTRSILVLCVFGAIACIQGCRGIKFGQITGTDAVGKHSVRITEPGNETGRSSLTHMPDGKLIYTYESDQFKVRLEDEVLTVNGKRYVLLGKDDSVELEDGRVEINGHPAEPTEASAAPDKPQRGEQRSPAIHRWAMIWHLPRSGRPLRAGSERRTLYGAPHSGAGISSVLARNRDERGPLICFGPELSIVSRELPPPPRRQRNNE